MAVEELPTTTAAVALAVEELVTAMVALAVEESVAVVVVAAVAVADGCDCCLL